MSKLGNLNPELALAPFKKALGTHFPKLVNIAKAKLGQWEKDIKSEVGDWKVTNKCVLTSKEGHKIQMPMNDCVSIFMRFGMQLNQLSEAGHFQVDAEIPKECVAYVDTLKQRSEEKVTA